MPSWIVAAWAGASTAAIAAAGAGALYWTHPELFGAQAVAVAVAPAPPPRGDDAGAPFTEPSAAPVSSSTGDPEPTQPVKPAFDIVRVEPTGETVVAGRAAPNAKVELRDGGRVVANAVADGGGQFVMLPEALAPGAHELALATAGEQGAARSNPIAVTVAARPVQPAAAAPEAHNTGAAAPSPDIGAGPAPSIAVKSVEPAPEGGFVVRGGASPNATVRLYLSGAYVGDAKTGADGHWSLTVQHGMTPGAYTMRADEINPADAAVLARAEAPFDYPRTQPGRASAAPASSAADIVVDSVRTAHVEPGNTLWGLSQTFYGDGSRYQLIFAANTGQIRNPDLIYPGQTFVVPKPEGKP